MAPDRNDPIQLSDHRTPERATRGLGGLLADPEVADIVHSFLRLPPGPARRAAIRLVRALDAGPEGWGGG